MLSEHRYSVRSVMSIDNFIGENDVISTHEEHSEFMALPPPIELSHHPSLKEIP